MEAKPPNSRPSQFVAWTSTVTNVNQHGGRMNSVTKKPEERSILLQTKCHISVFRTIIISISSKKKQHISRHLFVIVTGRWAQLTQEESGWVIRLRAAAERRYLGDHTGFTQLSAVGPNSSTNGTQLNREKRAKGLQMTRIVMWIIRRTASFCNTAGFSQKPWNGREALNIYSASSAGYTVRGKQFYFLLH